MEPNIHEFLACDSTGMQSGELTERHLARDMEVAIRAYELWQMAGSPPGRDLHFWFMAEREQMAELPSRAAAEEIPRQAERTRLGSEGGE